MARYGDLDTQYFDDAGDPLINGKIFFFETGTTTPKPTFADVNFTIPNAHPVILTAAGRQPNIFFQGVAKAVLATSAGVQILVRDPVGETASNFGSPWVASKDYNADDVVQGSDGNFYRSLVNGNVNNNPVTTSGSWTFLYSVEWSAGTTYKTGSVVTYETIVYQSLQNANLNQNPSTATSFWVPIQLVWSATSVYALNANVVGTDGILYTSLQAANTGNIPASSPSFWVGTSAAAAASATAALASQVAAATSASTATTQAGLASTSASTSTTQAGIATTQAGISTTQAGNASTSASAASTSAGNAATSESNAAATYDLFDDRYLGAKAADPTLDNDGNALVTGAMYFNTVSNTTRIYNGASWQDTAALATTINLATQVTGTLPIANGGTGTTSTTFANLATNVTGTLPVGNGGTGATTLTGVLKGNGTGAFTAATAGTDFVAPATATTFTATQTFSGSTSTLAVVLNDAAEVATVSATAATGTIAYDITTQSVLYYTSNASANWTVNFRGSSGTSLNTLMATGESMTVAFLVTQGATAYYNSAVQVDGTTSGVTTRWLGGAPTAGNASGIDSYRYLIIKTGSAAYTVLASVTQFKA